MKGAYKIYREECAKGLTYKEIADKYGVSRQNVSIACAKMNIKRFQLHPPERIVFPDMRKWMNGNKVSVLELTRRMGLVTAPNNVNKVRLLLKGKSNPRKSDIDKLIKITGLTYEKLFRR